MDTIISFHESAIKKVAYPADNFVGMNCAGAGSMELSYERADGTANAEQVTLTVTHADGVGFKRAAQAVANAMGGYTHAGKYVKIADSLTGAFINPNITAVSTV